MPFGPQNYLFDTISPTDALNITQEDMLAVAPADGPVTNVTILYATDGTGDITMSMGGHTVLFGPAFAALTQNGNVNISANTLYIGDGGANLYTAQGFGNFSYPSAAFGGDGDDSMIGNGANDLLQGNAGTDSLAGGDGDDTIYGGQGADRIDVGAGFDFGQGNKGNDSIAGVGVDTLLGGQGDDTISGAAVGVSGTSVAVLDGNLGDDSVSGGGQLLGEGGDDTLVSAGSGNDTLDGGDGNDSIVAGAGADSITGGAGNDTISIGGHAQRIAGGGGNDVFILNTDTTTVGSVPAITDWTASTDKISFAGYTANPSDFTAVTNPDYASAVSQATQLITQNHYTFVAVQVGADVVIFAGGSGGVTSAVDLVGRSLNDFDPHNNLI